MTRSGRLLCALYLTTSGGLVSTTFLEFLHGPRWAACLFAAASLVPVIAVVRETLVRDLRRAAAAPRRPVRPAADDVVRTELEGACCERWWTSLGTRHDTGCPHPTRRSSAA
ncbi:hypothetical protein LXH13_36445 [Streptomyces spinosirectus]|jgi:hypothetical protein|uniref:hypothetical protein n=1 Tax=Streptomyces TaxID=1883 RepID=UPI000D34E8E2|nr:MULTISPECIES: hypothetical protein [Streptomyces]MBY8344492.1 hypothetical protein [Streptomyces plumbidurans]PTM84340.1 hypothetical protein C7821_12427 [Streptomyces sp. VMFN-G11Ma]UIR22193.1 hypothetical protein LXH13_36445 [Streptomyces spinosirectus]